AVFGCAPYFLENIYAILLTRCALGVCVSAVVTASTTMISDYFKGRARERWFAAQAAVSAISAVVLIWVGGRLGASLGWRGPFLAYAYSIVLAIAIWVLTWEPSEESPEELTANEDVSYTEFPLARMLGICIVTLGASITFYAVSTQNANALVTLGVHDPAEIGRLSAVATFGTVLGTAAFGVLGRLPTAGLLTLDFALLGLGFVLMAASGSAQVYTMSAVVQQFGCGLVLPTLLVWATCGLAFRIRGRAIGMWQAAFQVGQLLSGITITFLAAHSAGLLAAFSTLGVACLGAAVVSGLAAFTLLRRSGRARASIENRSMSMNGLARILLAGLLVSGAAHAQQWQTYTYPNPGFAIQFPGVPEVQTTTFRNAVGVTLPLTRYVLRQEGVQYTLSVVNYSTTNADALSIIGETVKSFRAKGKVTSNTGARVNGSSGREL